MESPNSVLQFWLEEVGPEGWYSVDEALDDKIRFRFLKTWRQAQAGGLHLWQTRAETCLAYLILTDQFPRNMFRGAAQAFATDNLARAAAKKAVDHDWDLRVAEPQRQFFYLPLMHSECLSDQERCVRLMLTRMPESGAENLLHARAHRALIRQFGRFPYRNEALARSPRPEEQAFLSSGGYSQTLQELRA